MSKSDNHVDEKGVFVDSILLKVQNSGIDYAENPKAPVSVVLAEARQQLNQYYADFYRNKIPEMMFDFGQIIYIEDTGGKRVEWLKKKEEVQKVNGTGNDFMDGYNHAIRDMRRAFNENV